MLPILEKSLDRWQADYRIVERICKCLRFIIRFLSRNSGPILQVRNGTFQMDSQTFANLGNGRKNSGCVHKSSTFVLSISDIYFG